MVITFGVELPMEFILFIDAALAKSDPVRLLKAGTVVSCIAGAETGIWVIAVGTTKNDFIFSHRTPSLYKYVISISK